MDPKRESDSVARIPVRSRFVLSIKAVAGAWLIFNFGLFCSAAYHAIFNRYAWANSENPFFFPLMVAIGSAIVVFLVWAVIALPLALTVPDRSAFWNPIMLVLIGAVAANVILWLDVIYNIRSAGAETIYNLNAFYRFDVVRPGIPCTLIGGLTGGIAAHLHKRLRSVLSTRAR